MSELMLEQIIEQLEAYSQNGEGFKPFPVSEEPTSPEEKLAMLINRVVGDYDTYRQHISADLDHVYEAVSRMSSGEFDVSVDLKSTQLAPLDQE